MGSLHLAVVQIALSPTVLLLLFLDVFLGNAISILMLLFFFLKGETLLDCSGQLRFFFALDGPSIVSLLGGRVTCLVRLLSGRGVLFAFRLVLFLF